MGEQVSGRYVGRRVLVTGATGFIGSHLTRALVREGAIVYATRRSPDARTRVPVGDVEWIPADLTDAGSLAKAVRTADPAVVFNLAAYGTTFDQKDPEHAYRVNVDGSWNLWRALDGSGARLIHAGSCGEYGQAMGQVTEDHVCKPTWFYPATKNASVVLLSTLGLQYGRETVSLRPFGPYGEGDDANRVIPHVVRALLRGEEVRVTPGEQLRDYAHVDDHVDAILLAGARPLPHRVAIYNTGSGEVITLRTLLEAVADAVGPDARSLLRFGAVPYRDSEVWEMCCDIGAARRDLGYAPRVSLAEGLRRTATWFRERAATPAGAA